MSWKWFEHMLADLEFNSFVGYQRWLSAQNPIFYALPELHPDCRNYSRFNRYGMDCFMMDYYRVPHYMPQNMAFPSYENFCLLRRTERKNCKNCYQFPRERHHWEKRCLKTRQEDNIRSDRGNKHSDVFSQFERRSNSSWSRHPRGNPFNHEQKTVSKGSFRYSSVDLRGDRFPGKNSFTTMNRHAPAENSNVEPAISNSPPEPNTEYYHLLNKAVTEQTTSTSADDMSQDGMSTASVPVDSSNNTWYCSEEQQQIVDMLKEVDMRHDRQLLRDMQEFKERALNESASSQNSQNSESLAKSLSSDDEDDGINIILFPTHDSPVDDIPVEDNLIMNKGYFEESARDVFAEFQSIFTASPEKEIINELTKENSKEESELNKKVGKYITTEDKENIRVILDFDDLDDSPESLTNRSVNIVSSFSKENEDNVRNDHSLTLSPKNMGERVLEHEVNFITSLNVEDVIEDKCFDTSIVTCKSGHSSTPSESSLEWGKNTFNEIPCVGTNDHSSSLKVINSSKETEEIMHTKVNDCNVGLQENPINFSSNLKPLLNSSAAKYRLGRTYSDSKSYKVNASTNSDCYLAGYQERQHIHSESSISEPNVLQTNDGSLYRKVSIDEIFRVVKEHDSLKNEGVISLGSDMFPSPDVSNNTVLSPTTHLKQLLGIGKPVNNLNGHSCQWHGEKVKHGKNFSAPSSNQVCRSLKTYSPSQVLSEVELNCGKWSDVKNPTTLQSCFVGNIESRMQPSNLGCDFTNLGKNENDVFNSPQHHAEPTDNTYDSVNPGLIGTVEAYGERKNSNHKSVLCDKNNNETNETSKPKASVPISIPEDNEERKLLDAKLLKDSLKVDSIMRSDCLKFDCNVNQAYSHKRKVNSKTQRNAYKKFGNPPSFPVLHLSEASNWSSSLNYFKSHNIQTTSSINRSSRLAKPHFRENKSFIKSVHYAFKENEIPVSAAYQSQVTSHNYPARKTYNKTSSLKLKFSNHKWGKAKHFLFSKQNENKTGAYGSKSSNRKTKEETKLIPISDKIKAFQSKKLRTGKFTNLQAFGEATNLSLEMCHRNESTRNPGSQKTKMSDSIELICNPLLTKLHENLQIYHRNQHSKAKHTKELKRNFCRACESARGKNFTFQSERIPEVVFTLKHLSPVALRNNFKPLIKEFLKIFHVIGENFGFPLSDKTGNNQTVQKMTKLPEILKPIALIFSNICNLPADEKEKYSEKLSYIIQNLDYFKKDVFQYLSPELYTYQKEMFERNCLNMSTAEGIALLLSECSSSPLKIQSSKLPPKSSAAFAEHPLLSIKKTFETLRHTKGVNYTKNFLTCLQVTMALLILKHPLTAEKVQKILDGRYRTNI